MIAVAINGCLLTDGWTKKNDETKQKQKRDKIKARKAQFGKGRGLEGATCGTFALSFSARNDLSPESQISFHMRWP
jgi:hypothetical protein